VRPAERLTAREEWVLVIAAQAGDPNERPRLVEALLRRSSAWALGSRAGSAWTAGSSFWVRTAMQIWLGAAGGAEAPAHQIGSRRAGAGRRR
jgi:hypothetical protein